MHARVNHTTVYAQTHMPHARHTTHRHMHNCTYVHTYIHTHKNNYTDTLDKCTLHTTQCKHRNTYKQICTNTSAYTQICTYTHKCIHIGILVHKYIIYTHMNIIT